MRYVADGSLTFTQLEKSEYGCGPRFCVTTISNAQEILYELCMRSERFSWDELSKL